MLTDQQIWLILSYFINTFVFINFICFKIKKKEFKNYGNFINYGFDFVVTLSA